MNEKPTELTPLPDSEETAITPMSMLNRAITSGADIDVMERLMGLQERWEANEARKAFSGALAALRDNLPKIIKTQQVTYGNTRYSYEDLAEVVEAVSGPMADHDLSFRWRTDSDKPGHVTVTCILEHADGHSEETTLSGPYDDSGQKNAIQAIGSVTTYLQRYTLKAALGIAAARDDDGRHGAPQGKAPARRRRTTQTSKPAAQPPIVMTDEARAKTIAALREKIRGMDSMNRTQFGQAIGTLNLEPGQLTSILNGGLAQWLEANPEGTALQALEVVLTALDPVPDDPAF
tara:strand:+ start:135 stop:1007 length:873 start_codon:yes stop_codon:yes gene_type:complete